MKNRHLIISMVFMLLLALFIIPAAHAVPNCAALPGPGVDWSGCDKTNQDFSGQDLSNMILVGTNFAGSDINGTLFVGSDLTNASMINMASNSGVIVSPNFNEATVQGLNLSSNSIVTSATFVDAIGTPSLPAAPPAIVLIQCPDRSFSNTGPPYCSWLPTAVSLAGISGAVTGSQLPYLTVGVLGIVTMLLFAGFWQRKAKTAAA